MGQNLISHDDHGFTVVAFTAPFKGGRVLKQGSQRHKCHRRALDPGNDWSPQETTPRDLMVKAGAPLMIHRQLLPHLEAGDIIIDGEIRFSKTLFAAPNTSNRRSSNTLVLRIRRRGRRAARPEHHAGGSPGAGRTSKTSSENCRQSRRWHALLRLVGENGAGHYVKMSQWN